MPTIALNGIDLYYEIHGVTGGSWVLNIGGSGGDLRRTFPDRSPLNTSLHVLSYDQRGLGRTSKPDARYTMAEYADDAAALIEAVVAAPCHVIGTSFGGMVALHLVLRRPDLVRRLVLNCTSPGGDHASYPLHELELMDPEDSFAIRMRNMDQRWDPTADEPIPRLGPIYDRIAAESWESAPDEVVEGSRRQLEARSHHDVVDRLASIQHETLICAGRYDGTAPLVNSELMASEMPNARLEVFEGGHLFMWQDRSAFPMIADFLH